MSMPGTLRSKLLLAVVLATLLVGTAGILAFVSGSRQVIDELAGRFAVKQALLEKNKLHSLIDREVALARKLADDPLLRRWARAENDPLLKGEALAQLESYRRIFRDRSFFIALAPSRHYYVSANKGERSEIARADLDPGRPADHWFFATLKEVDDYALNLDYNLTLQEAKVWVNAVMRDAGGDPLAVGGGGISLSAFLAEVVAGREAGVETILFDRQGVIQAHRDRDLVERNARTWEDPTQRITIASLLEVATEREALRQGMATLARDPSGSVAFPLTMRGGETLAAMSYLPEIGWYNLVLVDVGRVVALRDFWPLIVATAVALLTVLLLAAVFVDRLVLRPLGRLTAATRQVAAGAYDVELDVTRRDEIGALSASFAAMASTVRDHTQTLEEKVRLRTVELSDANVALVASRDKIDASLAYARLIQSAILPDERLLRAALRDVFVLYAPCEVVGGDFYYLRRQEGRLVLAVLDCTGHGVPGAFMTMAVHSVLHQTVAAHPLASPGELLAELNARLKEALDFREIDAGLDVGLCVIEPAKSLLTFAGAGLSLFVADTAGVREVRGDRQRVGYRGSRLDFSYGDRSLTLREESVCYLTSDGLLDENGGERGYAFGTARFVALLEAVRGLSLDRQHQTLREALDSYRGARPQRDDITVVGFRV